MTLLVTMSQFLVIRRTGVSLGTEQAAIHAWLSHRPLEVARVLSTEITGVEATRVVASLSKIQSTKGR
jgi:hypothetical protein